jgi:threonine synthase
MAPARYLDMNNFGKGCLPGLNRSEKSSRDEFPSPAEQGYPQGPALGSARVSFLSHLECGKCGARHDADAPQNLCRSCGKPLLARYDLDAARERVTRATFERGPDTLWRFAPLLPVRDAKHVVSLGEGMTPLLDGGRLGANLLVKDETGNPTGSFKARGMSVAVSRAVELGLMRFAVPSAGNAGAALAAYAARAGASADVYLPADTPRPIWRECEAAGATVHAVKGLITDAAKEVQARQDVFDVSTLREPYRIEGKKTMGYELALQLGWTLPDVIVYPTGGGTGLVGMWKAFDEMERLGLLGSARPRMVSVQAEGCAPIARAFQKGDETAAPWENAQTTAWGLRVPRAIGDFLILRAIRESRGTALAVSEAAIAEAKRAFGREAGMLVSEESAATLAAARQLRDEGAIGRGERVVLFATGAAWPYGL